MFDYVVYLLSFLVGPLLSTHCVGVEGYCCTWSQSKTLKHSVGILWTRDRPVAETSTSQHTTLTTDRHPCPRRGLSPQSQQARIRGLRMLYIHLENIRLGFEPTIPASKNPRTTQVVYSLREYTPGIWTHNPSKRESADYACCIFT